MRTVTPARSLRRRWLLGTVLGLIPLAAVTCSGAGSRAPAPAAVTPERGPDAPLPPDAELRRDDARGTVRLLRAANLSASLEATPEFRALQTGKRWGELALAFVSGHRALFGLESPAEELAPRAAVSDDLGLTHVRFQQRFRGLTVWAAELNVHVDRAGHVYLVQGRYVRTPAGLDLNPGLEAESARRRAAAAIAGAPADCRGCRSELLIFVGSDERARLAHRVLVEVSLIEGWAVMVDAHDGAILDKVSTVFQR